MHATGHTRSKWLHRPLCVRYASIHLKAVRLVVRDGDLDSIVVWQWIFGMFAEGEFEVLGAWPDSAFASHQIFDDLADRGVKRAKLICFDDPAKKPYPSAFIAPINASFVQNALRVDGVISSGAIATQFSGRKRRSLLSALAAAERQHAGLVRALHRHAPFASTEAASEFIAGWLQRADRRLYEARRPAKPVLAYAA